jgi:hypothetical protein
MGLLTQVEMPGGSVDAYVRSLDRVLERKVAAVEKLRLRLSVFQQRCQPPPPPPSYQVDTPRPSPRTNRT